MHVVQLLSVAGSRSAAELVQERAISVACGTGSARCWPSSELRWTRAIEIRGDSTAEVRYLVVPMRPNGTEGLDEESLAALVTRDSMIGTGLAGVTART